MHSADLVNNRYALWCFSAFAEETSGQWLEEEEKSKKTKTKKKDNQRGSIT
jgi:hypothetical protein